MAAALVSWAMAERRWAHLPKKRMAAGALFFDQRGHLLVVKSVYKDGWGIPGGVIEADESPKEGCAREVKEELGLDVAIGRLLVVDYIPPDDQTTESLQFIFYGGVLDPALIDRIRLQVEELSAFRFLPPQEAVALLSPNRLGRRVPRALEALEQRTAVYLHDGHEA